MYSLTFENWNLLYLFIIQITKFRHLGVGGYQSQGGKKIEKSKEKERDLGRKVEVDRKG